MARVMAMTAAKVAEVNAESSGQGGGLAKSFPGACQPSLIMSFCMAGKASRDLEAGQPVKFKN